jgi:hypothetical protein
VVDSEALEKTLGDLKAVDLWSQASWMKKMARLGFFLGYDLYPAVLSLTLLNSSLHGKAF